MKTVYEVYHTWTDYGRPGGTPLDFDVSEGSELVGQFETREEAERELQKLREKSPGSSSGINGELSTDGYEIKIVEVA